MNTEKDMTDIHIPSDVKLNKLECQYQNYFNYQTLKDFTCWAEFSICSVNCLMSLSLLGAKFWLMAANDAWSNSLML